MKGVKDSVVQKYSESAHFVYELLQNADDCEATEVHFELRKNGLRFWHNGCIHFSIIHPDLENSESYSGPNGHINAIAAIGNSPKSEQSNDGQKIGKFGVGFKAVFQYTSTPHIYDDNFCFKIENLIIPRLLEKDDEERKQGETLFYFPFDSLTKPAKIAFDDIDNKFRYLEYPTLFLNHLKKIYWSVETDYGEDSGEYYQEEELLENVERIVKKVNLIKIIEGEDITNEKIILISRKEETKELYYSVGFFIDEAEKTVVPKSVPAFCYFKTAKETKLSFLVHAPYLLTDSREGLMPDAWNDKLNNLLASLAAESLPILCEMELVHDNIFDIIPYSSNTWEFKYVFYQKFAETLKNKAVIPCYNGGYVSAEHAYWPISSTIPEFLPERQLSDLVKDEYAKWVFVKNNYKTLMNNNKPLAEYMNNVIFGNKSESHQLDERNIFSKFTTSFIESQPIEWLHVLYEYLLDNKTSRDLVKHKEIFLDTSKKAVAAYRHDWSNKKDIRILFTNTIEGLNYTTLLPELLDNPTTKSFIEEFGIGSPDIDDEIDDIISNTYRYSQSSDEIKKNIFKKLYEYYKICPQNKIDSFTKSINCKELLLHDNICNCYDSAVYFDTNELKNYRKNASVAMNLLKTEEYRGMFVEDEFPDVFAFLEKIGVRKTICITRIGHVFCSDKKYLNEIRQKNNITYNSRSITDYYYPELDKHLENMSLDISKLIWDSTVYYIKRGNNTLDELMAKHGKYRQFVSSVLWKLKNSEWLFTSSNELRSPSQIHKCELNIVYDTKSDAAKVLCEFLDFMSDRHVTVYDKLKELLKLMPEDEVNKILDKAHNDASNKNLFKIAATRAKFDPDCEIDYKDIKNNGQIDISNDVNEQNENQDITYNRDPQKEIEELQKKIEKESHIKEERSELVDNLNKSQKYSYEWFLSFIKLLSTYSKTTSQSPSLYAYFNSMRPENGSNRFFTLGGSSEFIPENISESEGIKIKVRFEDGTSADIDVDGISRKGQDIQILTSGAIDNTLIEKLITATSIEIVYTPVIDLTKRLLAAFSNKGFINVWNDIKTALPPIDYIYGPPGTGKTYTLANRIVEMTDGNRAKILVLTPTNTAADEVCKKLVELGATTKFARLSSPTDYELEQQNPCYIDTLTMSDMDCIDVVASTIHRLPYYRINGDNGIEGCNLFQYKWDYVIFDESSMIGLHYITFAFMAISKENHDAKFVVAGDPMQIPPVVEISDDEFENFDIQDENIYSMMGVSDFKNTKSQIRVCDEIQNLDEQWRSVPEIGDLFSDFSYFSLVSPKRSDSDKKDLPSSFQNIMKSSVTFVDIPLVKTEEPYQIHKLNGSSYHFYSAIMVMEILKRFDEENQKDFNEEWTIGLISPYKAQALLMDKLIKSYNLSDNIKVVSDTVHGFQGGQCDIVFFVCNPSTYGFLTDSKRCLMNKKYIYNVAISRAADYLVVFHPFAKISNNLYINKITESYKNHNGQSRYIPYSELEKIIFGQTDYVKEKSYVTGHDQVNVYNTALGKNYILKYGDNALDVQVMNGDENDVIDLSNFTAE